LEEFTVRLIVVVCVSVPDVPVTVIVDVPVVAVALAVKIKTLVEVVGLVPKLAVTPAGRVDVESVTLPVNPPDGLTVIVLLPLAPCVTAKEAGEAERVKFGAAAATTVRLTVVVCVSDPDVPVMVTVEVPVVAVALAVKVKELLPVVGLVPKLAVTPDGSAEVDNVTLPAKPPEPLTVIVFEAEEPCVTETLAGEAERLKFGAAAPARALIRFWPLGLPQPVTRS